MGNLWSWLKGIWEKKKQVILDYVIPQLDMGVQELSAFLVSKGITRALADQVAIYAIAWAKEYLQRQL